MTQLHSVDRPPPGIWGSATATGPAVTVPGTCAAVSALANHGKVGVGAPSSAVFSVAESLRRRNKSGSERAAYKTRDNHDRLFGVAVLGPWLGVR